MRALFIQHDPGADPGLVGRALERRGYEPHLLPMAGSVHDGTWHGRYPDPRAFEVIVSLGAIWSLYDRMQVGSWIDRELDLLRAADTGGIPVLGICFGGQALAAAHGGVVEVAQRPEIGWTSVDSDDPDLVPGGPWMQWHTDRFTIPAGATEIARNAVCPQAFRLRRNLAVQFHPEVDEDIVAKWLELGGRDAIGLVEATGGSVGALLSDARAQRARAEADVERMVGGFLRDVAGLA